MYLFLLFGVVKKFRDCETLGTRDVLWSMTMTSVMITRDTSENDEVDYLYDKKYKKTLRFRI